MTKTRSILLYVLIGLVALTIPAILSTFAQVAVQWYLGYDQEGLTNWFSRAGQFGDQYGFITCGAAVIAAIFSYRTYQSQKTELADERKRSAESDRERHFFILYQDMMVEFGRIRSLPISGATNQNTYEWNTVIEAGYYIFKNKCTQQADGETLSPERILSDVSTFVDEIKKSVLLSRFRFLTAFYKFEIVYGYLQGQNKEFPRWAIRVFYETIFSSLRQHEAKALGLLWIIREHNVNAKDPLGRSFIFINEYVRYLTGNLVDKRQAIEIMTSTDEIGNYFKEDPVQVAINRLAIKEEAQA